MAVSVETKVFASDLHMPEGPVVLEDGSVVLVELAAGRLRRVWGDGKSEVVATTGGGPNGLAMGPDGALYVCNSGGHTWERHGAQFKTTGIPKDYTGGWIERVNLSTGKVERVYDSVNGSRLRAPNDLVFDAHGNMWFTDMGKMLPDVIQRGRICYANPNGSSIVEAVYPVLTPNGIGLSPDGRTLYMAETQTARLWAWDVTGPGQLARDPEVLPYGGRLIYASPEYVRYDSMAVEADGNICVGTLARGGVTVCSPRGGLVEFVPMLNSTFVTNLCFGGRDMKTAYVTASDLGLLLEVKWPRAGLRLNYN